MSASQRTPRAADKDDSCIRDEDRAPAVCAADASDLLKRAPASALVAFCGADARRAAESMSSADCSSGDVRGDIEALMLLVASINHCVAPLCGYAAHANRATKAACCGDMVAAAAMMAAQSAQVLAVAWSRCRPEATVAASTSAAIRSDVLLAGNALDWTAAAAAATVVKAASSAPGWRVTFVDCVAWLPTASVITTVNVVVPAGKNRLRNIGVL